MMQFFWTANDANDANNLEVMCRWYYDIAKEVLIWLIKAYDLQVCCSADITYVPVAHCGPFAFTELAIN